MNELKEAILEFIKEISENLVGSLNLGLNSASGFNDRLDFLLAYVLLGFNASYGMREFQMYQAQYENYVRKLAEEKEQELEFEEKKSVKIAKKEEVGLEEVEVKEEVQSTTPTSSLNVSQSANDLSIAQVGAVLTGLTIMGLTGETKTLSLSSKEEEVGGPPPLDFNGQIALTLFVMAGILDINEDSGSTIINFFDVAQLLGFNTSDPGFLGAFNAMFPGNVDVHSPIQCTYLSLIMHRVGVDLNGDGDFLDAGEFRAGDFEFTTVPAAQTLGAGETGVEIFSFNVGGFVAPLMVSFPILGRNDPPTMATISPGVAGEDDVLLEFDLNQLLGPVTDPDGGDIHTVTAVSGPPGIGFTFNPVTGLLNMNLGQFETLSTGVMQLVPFLATLSDGNQGSLQVPFNVSVTGANDAPVAVADLAAGNENQVLNIDVLANDTDVDVNDVPANFSLDSVSLGNVSTASAAILGIPTVSIVANQLVFTPGAAFDGLAAGETATVVVNYIMSDNEGASSNSTATITVTGTNDTPTAAVISPGGFNEDDPNMVVNVNSQIVLPVTDVDVADTHTVTALTSASGVAFSYVPATGFLNITPGQFENLGGFSGVLPNQNVLFSATVTDNNGASVAGIPFNVVITGQNDAPSTDPAGGILNLVTHAPAALPTDPTSHTFVPGDFNFFDVDTGDTLQFIRIVSLPIVGQLLLGGVAVTVGQVIPVASIVAGLLVHQAAAAFNSLTSFEFNTSDGALDSTDLTMFVTIDNASPFVQYDHLGTGVPLTTLPRFLVDDLPFDDPFGNDILPFGALNGQVQLEHYIEDVEGDNMTFTHSNLPSWLAPSNGVHTNNLLSEIAPTGSVGGRTALPFMSSGVLTTVNLTVTDSGVPLGTPLVTTYEIFNYRLEFDAFVGLNNAPGGVVTSTHFTNDAPADDAQASSIYILNAGGEDLYTLGSVLDWDIVGGEYQITVGDPLGFPSTAVFDSSAIPLSVSPDFTEFKVRIGNDAMASLAADTTSYRGLLGTASVDSIVGVADEFNLQFGLGGDDTLVGNSLAPIASGVVAGDELLNGGAGVDLLIGDSQGSIEAAAGPFPAGVAGDDILMGGPGADTLIGDTPGAIDGLAGHDMLLGGDDGDTIYTDTMLTNYDGRKGIDTVFGGPGDDMIFGGSGAATLPTGVFPNLSNVFEYDLSIDNGDDIIDRMITNQHASLFDARGVVSLFNVPGDTLRDLGDSLDFTTTPTQYVASLSDAGTSSTITFNSFTLSTLGNTLDVWLDGTPFVIEFGQTTADAMRIPDPSSDAYYSIDGNDVVIGDILANLATTANSQLLVGGVGNDTLVGDSNGDLVFGGQGGNDVLFGGDGSDTLRGDVTGNLEGGTSGEDILFGGPGGDNLAGDFGGVYLGPGITADDIFIYDLALPVAGANGTDTILNFDFTDDGVGPANIGDDTILLTNALGHTLSDLADVVRISTAAPNQHRIFLDSTVDGPGPASNEGTIFIGGTGLVDDYTFEIEDSFVGFSYNVAAGHAADDTIDVDLAAGGRELVFGLGGDDVFVYDFSGAFLPPQERIIGDFEELNGNEIFVLDFAGTAPSFTAQDFTEIRGMGPDLDDNGASDIILDVFDSTGSGGNLLASVTFYGINFTAGLTELSDYIVSNPTVI